MNPDRWWPATRHRLRALLRRRDADRALAAELQDHVAREVEAEIARGVAPVEARRRARARLRGLESVAEACREARGLRLLDEWGQDPGWEGLPVELTAGIGTLAVGVTVIAALGTTVVQMLTIDRAAVAAHLAGRLRTGRIGPALTSAVIVMQPLVARKAAVTWRERQLAAASGVVGWLALVLSAVGLYGLLVDDVGRRRREIGAGG